MQQKTERVILMGELHRRLQDRLSHSSQQPVCRDAVKLGDPGYRARYYSQMRKEPNKRSGRQGGRASKAKRMAKSDKHADHDTDGVAAEVCAAYMGVLQWTFLYYVGGTQAAGWGHRCCVS